MEPRYEFLRKSSYKRMADGSEGYRLKTMRLRGAISQGLLMLLAAFNFETIPKIGEDISELLGVRKYEPPIPASLGGNTEGLFLGYLQKSDQERIQNLPDYFSFYQNSQFEVTEKLDGTSMTSSWRDGEFKVLGRNIEWKESENKCLLENGSLTKFKREI